ncbi:MAG: sugar ABC transporter permease [Herpetosiphonaceae bacterium]|nr:sugar ABC transporter permease [Herpetosiphonaceae bacterium]
MNRGKNGLIVSFLALPLGLYSVFVLFPYCAAMLFAFTRWSGLSSVIRFNGLNNFIKLYNDEKFWHALSHNAIALVILPPITLGLALFFAFLFTQGTRFARFFRIAFFFPQVLSVVIVAVVWSFIYHPTVGLLNASIQAIGIKGLTSFPWLGDSRTVFGAVLGVVIWQSVGFYMVLFVAGMGSIPADYYEAARIDGASPWVMFWSVTVPLLWDTIRTAIIFIAIAAMDLFGIVLVMTNGTGGPSRAADVVPTYLFSTAFSDGNFGYASAMGLVLLVLVLVLSIVSLRFTARESFEY